MKVNQLKQHPNITELNQHENEIYKHLLSVNTQWAHHFIDVLPMSRDKISQRLISSIYRENIVNGQDNSRIMQSEGVLHHFFPENPSILAITFPQSEATLFADITGIHAFGRIDVQGPFYIETESGIRRIRTPEDVLNLILTEDANYIGPASQQFQDDMANSAANMALALSHQKLIMTNTAHTLWDVIAQSPDAYVRSEQAVVEGHPLHPGAKLRKGMSAVDTIAYASEFNHAFGLQFILIHQQVAQTQANVSDINQYIDSYFPGIIRAAESQLHAQSIEDYFIMCVHPWQYAHIVSADYQDMLERHMLIPFTYDTNYFAGLSFRTVMPKLPSHLPHIKLSTNVHITGEIRTLSEQTTFNGPLVTTILRDILKNDAQFQNIHSDIIDEIAGIHFYNADDAEDIQTDRSEQLGTLFRTNIYDLIPEHTIPVIPSSLVSIHHHHSEPPVVSLIKQFQQVHAFKDYETAAIAWLTSYARPLLRIVMPLHIKYGIALEAHLQNTIAAFNPDDGQLAKMYIRDFEGLRIDEQQLNHAGYRTDHFHSKSRILTTSKVSTFNKAFYSTIQNHLGELIIYMSRSSERTELESSLWHVIRHIALEIFDMLSTDEVDTTRLNEIKTIFFADEIDYKCVTTMRLKDEAHAYTYIKVDNPLARHH